MSVERRAKALDAIGRALTVHYARAQFNLGLMYEGGQGVAQDYAEAAKWWRKAAEQDEAAAQSDRR